MRHFHLTLSIAAAGIGLAGAGALSHTPGTTASDLRERTSSGTVARVLAPLISTRNDDDREKLRRTIRLAESGTYIADILNGRDSIVVRWPDRRGNPLLVWIQQESNVADWHLQYVHQVHSAFVAWDTLDLPVRFRIVADSSDAHVHVTWIDRFNDPISGRTRWTRDENYWITDASITLAVHHRTGEVLADDAMHAMALHEIGHLLGLDHTADPSSVMAPKVRVRRLSAADRATARLLYSVPAGVVGATRYTSR